MNMDEKSLFNAMNAMIDMILSDSSITIDEKIDFALARQTEKLTSIIHKALREVTLGGNADIHLKKETLEYFGMVEAGIRTFVKANNIEIEGE